MRKYTPLNLQLVLVKPVVEGLVKLSTKDKQAKVLEIAKEGLEVYRSSVGNIKAGDYAVVGSDTTKDDFHVVYLENEEGETTEYLSIAYSRLIGFYSLEVEEVAHSGQETSHEY